MHYDIFISYRRENGSQMARLLCSNLEERGYKCFLDVEELKAGHFDEALLRNIESSESFILVLSPGCLDRCRNKGDWLRREIAHAIGLKKRIVPVMLPGFQFPPPENLPEELRDLDRHNAVPYSNDFFKAMMEKLCSLLGKPKTKTPQKSWGLIGLLVGMVAILAGVVAYLLLFRTTTTEKKAASMHQATPTPVSSLIIPTVTPEIQPTALPAVAALPAKVKPQKPKPTPTPKITSTDIALWLAKGEKAYREGDVPQALMWLKKAGDQGDPTAENLLGTIYQNGHGETLDYPQAEEWFRKAAEQGNVSAEYNLGYMKDCLNDFPHNYTEALMWYQKAAAQGSPDAEAAIGRLYCLGFGVPQDYKKSLMWHQKAAAQGNGFADISIGYLYLQSQIGKNDYQDALKWFQKGVKDGYPNADKLVETAKQKMGQ